MIDFRKYLSRQNAFSEINITPFTDIVLVLLIIFMIAAPGLVQSGLSIDLPGASSADASQPAEINITLYKNGQIYLDGKVVQKNELERTLARRLATEKQNASVILNADVKSNHGQVIELLDLARGAGAKNIYIGARKQEGL